METLRWTIALLVMVPAAICTVMNFGLACRNLIFYTSRGPSPIPLIGFVCAVVGLLVLPKSTSPASRAAMIAFVAFLAFEASHPIVYALNRLRAVLTGTRPS